MSKIELPPGTLSGSVEPKPGIDPICESAIGELWALYKRNPRHPLVVGSGFVVRSWLFGRYADELRAWDEAGCPHMCGK